MSSIIDQILAKYPPLLTIDQLAEIMNFQLEHYVTGSVLLNVHFLYSDLAAEQSEFKHYTWRNGLTPEAHQSHKSERREDLEWSLQMFPLPGSMLPWSPDE